jgi:hypothetical protein
MDVKLAATPMCRKVRCSDGFTRLRHSVAATCEHIESRFLLSTSLAVWNFNDASTSGTGASNAALLLSVDRVATGVTATMTTNFPTTGSAALVSFAGSTVNADSSDAAGAALSVVGSANNGDSITFAVSAGTYSSLQVSFATQRTSTGYTGNQFQYSLDGTTFTNFGAAYVPASSFAVQSFDLTSITGLNNDASAAFRIVFNGASSTSGNNRIDNLVVAATLSPPIVTSLSPSTGAAGTSVTINGSGFTGATSVLFGSTTISSSNFTVNSAGTQITLTAPTGSGTEEIQVIAPGGSSATGTSVTGDKFTYPTNANSPTVTNVSPNNSPYGVSGEIVITGTNLLTATSVNFGSIAVTPTSIYSSGNYVVAYSPVLAGPGSVEISVTTSYGTSTLNGASVDGFTYTAPTIGSVTATSSDNNAGTQRTLTASSVAAESGYTISSVKFYIETGITAGYSADDTLVPGTVTSSGGNYSLNFTSASLSLAPAIYTFYAVATSSSGGIDVSSSTFTVVTPTIAFATTIPFFSESAGTVSLNVTRSGDVADAVNVDYNTSGGTAVAGTDYTAITSGVLRFPSGSATQTLTIPLTLLNPSGQVGTKTFNVNLYGATVGGTVVGAPASVGITQTPRAFTAGDLVIYQAGDGANALVATGNTIYLDEYSTSGTLVQSFPLPEYTAGNTNAEGGLTLSGDGGSLIVPGYASTGSGSTAITDSSILRAIDVVGPTGTIDSSTTIPGTEATGNFRSATSSNGTDLWFGTSSAGVRYIMKGNTASVALFSSTANVRDVEVINGQLYVSSGSGTAIRVAAVGSGLPTSGTQTATELNGVTTSTTTPPTSPYAYTLLHVSGPGTAADTLYIADDATSGGILKYSLIGGTWTSEGAITGANIHFDGVTASVNSGVVTLYMTSESTSTAGGSLYSVVDGAGSAAAPSTTSIGPSNLLVTSGLTAAFRGIAFAPTAVAGLPGWVTGAATYSSSTDTLTVTGTATITADPAGSSYNDGTVKIVAAGASAIVNTSLAAGSAIHIGSLNLSTGASATLANSSHTVLVASNIILDASSKLDIGNGYLDVTGGSLGTITSQIGQAYASGRWTGLGITSSTAANDSTHLTAVAAIVNTNPSGTALYTTFDGTATTSKNDVLVRYTYVGDSNLDGHVDASDYSLIDNGFLNHLTGWFNGDYNYDNTVNGSDYTLDDNAFNTQGPALAGATSQIASASKSHAITVPPVTAADNFFSDRKVDKSLIDQVEDLIVAVK